MRKRAILYLTCFLLTATLAFAGSGDLIVDGNLGVGTGTTTPVAKVDIVSGANMSGSHTDNPSGLSVVGPNRVLTGGGATAFFVTNTPYAADNGGSFALCGPVSDTRSATWAVIKGAKETSVVNNYNGYFAVAVQSHNAGMVVERLRVNSSGDVGIGTTNPGFKLDVQGTIGTNNAPVLTSDARFKKNLEPISTPLDKVLNLTGLTYEWKTDEYKEKGFAEGRHYGVIAQEIEEVLPEVVNTTPDGSKAVAYTEIIPVLIEAIKEQQKQIELLEKKVAALQK